MANQSLTVGCEVYTVDGAHLGKVKEVQANAFKVDAPMQPDYWLSSSCVRSMEGGQVFLDVTQERLGEYKMANPDDTRGMPERVSAPTSMAAEAPGHGWADVSPRYKQEFERQYATTGRRWEDAEPGYRYGYEMSSDPRFQGRNFGDVENELRGGYDTWAQRRGYGAGQWEQLRDHTRQTWGQGRPMEGTEELKAHDQRSVPLREEQLQARKETVNAGEVGVRKEVVTERQAMDVPVTREEVHIERRNVDPRPSDRPIGEGETIKVPVREERVTAEKQTYVTGEVEIDKRKVQETQRVEGEVRREEARIEREGDVDVRGDERDQRPERRQ